MRLMTELVCGLIIDFNIFNTCHSHFFFVFLRKAPMIFFLSSTFFRDVNIKMCRNFICFEKSNLKTHIHVFYSIFIVKSSQEVCVFFFCHCDDVVQFVWEQYLKMGRISFFLFSLSLILTKNGGSQDFRHFSSYPWRCKVHTKELN